MGPKNTMKIYAYIRFRQCLVDNVCYINVIFFPLRLLIASSLILRFTADAP